jgi:S1-C subfamily serine protease
MGLVRRVISVVLVLFATAALARAQDSLPAETVQQLKDASVYIKTVIGPVTLTGSGFVIDVTGDSALIVTNNHVISKPAELQVGGFVPWLRGRDRFTLRRMQQGLSQATPAVTVIFRSGNADEEVLKAQVVGAVPEPDLAILKVTGLKSAPRPIEYRKSPRLVETMPLWIFGFPFGDALATNNGNPNITVGKATVSSIRLDERGKLAKVQIDGTINPGNSGGPLVDGQGHLVGIAVQKVQGTNIGLAIPAADLESVVWGKLGSPVVTARDQAGKGLVFEVELAVMDPLKKLKSVTMHYVDSVVPLDRSKAGQPQLITASGSKTLDLKITDHLARATLPLEATADKKDREITVQLAYVNDQGQTVWLEPQRLRVGTPDLVTTTVTDGNTTTIIETLKTPSGTIRREIKVNNGGKSPPAKGGFGLKDDEEDEAGPAKKDGEKEKK